MIVSKPKKKKKNSRFTVLYVIMFIILGVITSKLLYLQVYKHDDYKEKADVGSTRLISEKAPRGNIYDSEGNVLATNNQTYVLTYMQTDEADKVFFTTMKKVFSILKENGEEFKDDLLLKVNSAGGFYFDFKVESVESQNSIELRFKRDRGLNEEIENKLFKDKKGDLTDSEISQVNSELMKITPAETFYYLVKEYDLYELFLPEDHTEEQASELAKKYKDVSGEDITKELLSQYSIDEIRKYIVVKDAIKMQSFQGYTSVTMASNIKRETAFVLYQKLYDLPGVDVSLEPVRYYPYKNLASHVIGYVSSISSSQEETYELRGYDVSSDLIGVSGIESAFESQLKGTKGGTTVKVNSQGRITEELFKLESYPGNNVYLTLDKDVQYAAQEALKDTIERIRTQEGQPNATRGAVVALDVNTGKVLAMASYPDFDPNDFAISGELSDEKFTEYFNPNIEEFGKEHISKTGAKGSLDELFPKNESGIREDTYDIYARAIFNYATQGLIPPGSTFKPLTAIAGLTEGVISTGEVMNDTGMWNQGDIGPLENFQKAANGATDLRKALQVSSNYFFYETGYRMYLKNGADVEALNSLAKYVWKFGLGVEQGKTPATGIEIEENFGQTYNFVSWRNNVASTVLYELVPQLESGSFKGRVFVPFDIAYEADDNDKLKEAKVKLKDNIKETLGKVGTDSEVSSVDLYIKELAPLVKSIMDASDKYKENVKNYESSKGAKVNADEQIELVSYLIADFVVSDKTIEIKSPGQIVSDAIGQGMNNFTPLQIANYVATLANGGTRYKISVVDKVTSPDGTIIQEFKPEVLDTIDIAPEYLQAVKDGMRRVNTSSANGLAYQSFADFPIAVAGKTGTADFGTEDQYSFQGRRPYGNYISFAPMDNPQIAIFSTIYDGNKGSSGATIHKAIYEAYFKDELLKIDSNYASKSSSFTKYVVNAPKDNKDEVLNSEKEMENKTDQPTE